MFVAVISRGMTVERVFSSINQKICEQWATNQAKHIFGNNKVDYVAVGEVITQEDTNLYISVLESERF